MSNRQECRNCGAKLKHDKTSDQYDPEYCSGKCRKADGAEPYVKTAKELAMVVEVVSKARPASLEDYKKNVPSKYARRFEPEKLNWSKNKMDEIQLKQAGFRANREPIPGDWDFKEKESVTIPLTALRSEPEMAQLRRERESVVNKQPSEWDTIRAEAKELGIKTHGKKREQIEAEIKEIKEIKNA